MSIKPYDHISSLKQIFEFGDLSVNAIEVFVNFTEVVFAKITVLLAM